MIWIGHNTIIAGNEIWLCEEGIWRLVCEAADPLASFDEILNS